ncbi:MAG: hypothetical protein IJJ33_15430 [Victivallales bacterium]|nr:hypothetical protein [Victivallales bacterium]
MIHHNFFTFCFLCIGIATKCASDVPEFKFVATVVYPMLLDEHFQKETHGYNSKNTPLRLPSFQTSLEIREAAQQENLGRTVQVRELIFKEILPGRLLQFLYQNGFAKEIRIVQANSPNASPIKVFQRKDPPLPGAMPENEEYREQTYNIIQKLLKEEDYFYKLKTGKYEMSFKNIEFLPYMWSGQALIQEAKHSNFFCITQHNRYVNIGFLKWKPLRLYLAITFDGKDGGNMDLASLFDEKKENGFECMFYPHQGLQFLTNKRNGKEEAVQVWDEDGHKRVVPYKKWFLWRTHQSQEL